jgi:histidinol phosphatase-like enzyme (inositol monophosphatase family)
MAAVAEVARAAGNRALEFYSTELVVEAKADGSPVTIADRSAEQLAREWIESRFPSDGIVGEEFGIRKSSASRRWIIDPIDGTKSFVRGVPLWGTLVAVMEGDIVIAGAAYFPALDEMVVAAAGEGCWRNDQRCSVSSVSEIADAAVLTTDSRFAGQNLRKQRWDELAGAAALSRAWGDCYGYCLVATGRAEVMADPVVSVWDIAALVPIIEEAGGVLTDWTGGSPFGGSAIATNAALAHEVRKILGVTNEMEQER